MMEVVVTTGQLELYKSCKALVKSSPTNQHPVFYRPDALPVGCLPTNSVKALKGDLAI